MKILQNIKNYFKNKKKDRILLSLSMRIIDDYLNAGHKKEREKVHNNAKSLYRMYYNQEYVNIDMRTYKHNDKIMVKKNKLSLEEFETNLTESFLNPLSKQKLIIYFISLLFLYILVSYKMNTLNVINFSFDNILIILTIPIAASFIYSYIMFIAGSLAVIIKRKENKTENEG